MIWPVPLAKPTTETPPDLIQALERLTHPIGWIWISGRPIFLVPFAYFSEIMSPKDLATMLLNCLFSFRECVVMEVVEAKKKNGCYLDTSLFWTQQSVSKMWRAFPWIERPRNSKQKIGSRPVYILYYNKLSVGWVSDGLKFWSLMHTAKFSFLLFALGASSRQFLSRTK